VSSNLEFKIRDFKILKEEIPMGRMDVPEKKKGSLYAPPPPKILSKNSPNTSINRTTFTNNNDDKYT
jgi:hypothetical protein